MTILTEIEQETPQHVMLFGPSFSGKTFLAGQLAKYFKLLWFDLEKGRSVLFKLPEELKKNIDLIAIPDSASFPIAAETIPKVLLTAETGKPVSLCTKHGKVNCTLCARQELPSREINLSTIGLDTIVVFDSGSQFTNSIICHVTKSEAEDYKLEFNDWGAVKFLVEKNMSRVQVAPYHTVWISHEEETETIDKKKKIVPVMGSSKTSRNVSRYFDHVIYCSVRNGKHIQGSATTYISNVLTGSRLDIQLERGEDLAAIFKPELRGIYHEVESKVNTKVKSSSNLKSLLKGK